MKRRNFLKSAMGGTAGLAALDSVRFESAQSLADWSRELQSLDETEFWKNVNRQFLLSPDIIHLNCGSIGACPKFVTQSLIRFINEIEQNPFDHFWGDGLCQNLENVRNTAAQFINASADEIAITRNTSEGMNLIARALDLKPGDEILTSNREHPGGIACWNYAVKQDGLKLRFVELPKIVQDPSQLLRLIENEMTDRTKVISLCHIDSLTGLILPVEQIAKLAKEKNVFFVCDGAQAPGMISVDVKKLGVDVYVSSGHKWMSAPKGTGFFYIDSSQQEKIHSLELSTGFHVYSAAGGTRNMAQVLAYETAMKFHETIGKHKIENRIGKLNNYLSEKLLGLGPFSRLAATHVSSGITAFEIDPVIANSNQLVETLQRDFKIYIKAVPPTFALNGNAENIAEDYNAIRCSTHIFNDEKQIDQAVDCIGKVLLRLNK